MPICRTYIINLARRQDKRRHMESEIKKILDCKPQFFDAIDGNCESALSSFEYNIPNWSDPNSGKAMTNGEVGCALSHWSIWKMIADDVVNGNLSLDSQIMILEDDVVIDDDFVDKYNSYSSEVTGYDMLYVHRKALVAEGESMISEHITAIRKNYWLCAYVLTGLGATKLISADYLANLIPADEFVPIMYGCHVMGFEKFYQDCQKLTCYAIKPSLARLKGNAFEESETFHSEPVGYGDTPIYVFEHDGTECSFCVLYMGPCLGQSYDRFIHYCKLYSLPCMIVDKKSINNADKPDLAIIQEFLNTWNQADLENTLLMVIDIDVDDQCNVLAIAPPREITEKYLEIGGTKIVSTPHEFLQTQPQTKCVSCGWASLYNKVINHYRIAVDNNPRAMQTMLHNVLNINSMTAGDVVHDNKSQIFLPLKSDSKITYNHRSSRVVNISTKTNPCIIIANDTDTIIVLNRTENYTGINWNEYYGYRNNCTTRSLNPKIYVSVLIEHNPRVADILPNLEYPANLLILTAGRLKNSEVEADGVTDIYDSEEHYYEQVIKKFLESDCDYCLFIGHDGVLTNPVVIKELLATGKDIVAPMIRGREGVWTNFWGDLDTNGYYRRSNDYLEIINIRRRGCWNVPYICGTFMASRRVFVNVPDLLTRYPTRDVDMRMCQNWRESDIYMYVDNQHNYGYLEHIKPSVNASRISDSTATAVEPVIVEPAKLLPSQPSVTLFDLTDQSLVPAWEAKYLHPKYLTARKSSFSNLEKRELCDGIYTFPLFSEIFCQEMIAITEKVGGWSQGKNNHIDHRLGKNFYENVPTVDVQLFQLNLQNQWKIVVFSYIAPFVRFLYNNYKTKDINLAFVVKYNYNDQASLEPHHDSSTYTINVALNRGNGVDYDGGGCRFIRQNIILKNQEPGMCCIHPGRLTAYHEGLPVTSGTRYILVSFVN